MIDLTPQMTAADIQAAIDLAAANAGSFGGRSVYIQTGEYDLGVSTLVVPPDVSLVAETGAVFVYSGNGVALDIYGNGRCGVRNHTLPHIHKPDVGGGQPQWHAGGDSASIGVRLNGLHYAQVTLGMVRNFSAGLVLRALESGGGFSQNCICNTLNVGQLINNKIGIDFQWNPSPTVAGVNQNTFIGGVVRVDSAWLGAGVIHLNLPDPENNQNTFVGTDLSDANAGALAIYCGSTNNLFLNARLENAGEDAIEFTATGINNTIVSGLNSVVSFGPHMPCVKDNGYGNKYITNDGIQSKKFKLDFNTGRMFFGDGSIAPSCRVDYTGRRLQVGQGGDEGVQIFGGLFAASNIIVNGPTFNFRCQHVIFEHAEPTSVIGSEDPGANVFAKVTFVARNANTTLIHNPGAGRFRTKSGANLVLGPNIPVTFTLVDGVWCEDN